jgi:dUTP pyrophosphatase
MLMIEIKDDEIYWAKIKPEAIIPTKRLEDGCYDIYVCTDEEKIVIPPHEIVTIPTGIASAFSHKYRLDYQRERGSSGSVGLVPRCGQVDSGYRGEIFLKMQNTTLKYITISKTATEKFEDEFDVIYPMSKAICQAALELVPVVTEKEISYEELLQIPSERGTGALGSSGK